MTAELRCVPPEAMGFDPSGWNLVTALAGQLCAEDVTPVFALQVVHTQRTTGPLLFESPAADASLKVTSDPIFLVASLTKPILAMGVVQLAERGLLALNDRVVDFIPEFSGADRRGITVRHLLTHTSGLPDMLPDNRELRREQAPLSRFISGTCEVPLDFPPGRGVQYQSMGYALLGEIISRVSGQPYDEYLRDALFAPLGMHDTALGAPESWWHPQDGEPPRVERIVGIRVPPEQEGGDDWNWNSRYWRSFGAPWGGLLSTPADLAIFCQTMLQGGQYGYTRVLSPAAVAQATRNQLDAYHDLSEADRRTRGWGFGWRMNWAAHSAAFCDLLGPAAYGHWGATGTLFWIDPARELAAILLTTQPLERGRSHLTRLSNAIVAALAD
ncbi:Esterase EstB [Maioricimonas rarisocia]|uniref:Esterase EstB n=1 Tax=Maioricimonas rarisocia TaxID=2528026 RepID=A0A517Z837_9PLAN|nr:serine hydrolase domain-containing protein [Maioricimonas rarisocia]QDU38660.1 Esterase EstB [Maioricimonas rarisocia]